MRLSGLPEHEMCKRERELGLGALKKPIGKKITSLRLRSRCIDVGEEFERAPEFM